MAGSQDTDSLPAFDGSLDRWSCSFFLLLLEAPTGGCDSVHTPADQISQPRVAKA